MRKSYAVLLGLVALLGGLAGGAVYALFWMQSPDFTNYSRIRVGMSVDDVQAILGPGTTIPGSEVPGIVVAVNSADDAAAAVVREKAIRSGVSPPTARNYPTRIRGVVEGDTILRWQNSSTGERILVAFQDGKVCDKHYYDPNYL